MIGISELLSTAFLNKFNKLFKLDSFEGVDSSNKTRAVQLKKTWASTVQYLSGMVISFVKRACEFRFVRQAFYLVNSSSWHLSHFSKARNFGFASHSILE
jgi:hypothetical protein